MSGGSNHSESKTLNNVNTNRLVIPNPQSKYAALSVYGLPKQPFDLLLMDMNGNVVLSRKNYQNDWSMSNLPTGIYFYRIVYRDENELQIIKTGKLVIVD